MSIECFSFTRIGTCFNRLKSPMLLLCSRSVLAYASRGWDCICKRWLYRLGFTAPPPKSQQHLTRWWWYAKIDCWLVESGTCTPKRPIIAVFTWQKRSRKTKRNKVWPDDGALLCLSLYYKEVLYISGFCLLCWAKVKNQKQHEVLH